MSMNSLSSAISAGAAVLLHCIAVSLPSALDADTAQGQVDPAASSIDANEVTSRPPLDFGSRCALPHSSASVHPICIRPPESGDPLGSYYGLVHRLNRGISDQDELCAIDSSLVVSLRECPLGIPDSYLDGIPALVFADMMQLLARSWKRQGWTERADELYGESYAMLRKSKVADPNLGGLGILREWIATKIALNLSEDAMSLARLHTSIAREHHNCTGGSRRMLIQSLWLQAETFRTFGHHTEAASLQNEAWRLAAVPKNCGGLCPGRPHPRKCE